MGNASFHPGDREQRVLCLLLVTRVHHRAHGDLLTISYLFPARHRALLSSFPYFPHWQPETQRSRTAAVAHRDLATAFCAVHHMTATGILLPPHVGPTLCTSYGAADIEASEDEASSSRGLSFPGGWRQGDGPGGRQC